MKRFLLELSVFTLFSIIVYVAFVILLGLYAPVTSKKNLVYTLTDGYENTYSRLKEVKNIKNVDIVVLGSSHAYRSYDPRIFLSKKITVFNLGTSSQTPIQTEFLASKYLEQLNPKMVIVDVYPKLFGSDGAECMIDLLQNTPIDKGLAGLTLKINNIKGYNSLIYCSYRQLFGLNKNLQERKVVDSEYTISGGYVETYKNYQPTIKYEENYIILEKQMEAFNRMMARLKEKGIKVILVQSPMTTQGYRLQRNSEVMDSIFSQKGTYYNFNKILQLPDSLFYNDDHLNQNGVEVFNRKLLAVMEESGLITQTGNVK